ncbi:carbohydrate phosphatase, partial [Meira miltonrushii]
MIPSIATSFDPAQAVGQSLQDGPIDLEVIHDFAVNVILRAGALLRKHTLLRASQSRQESQSIASTSALHDTEVKASQVDLVTKVDIALEDFIRQEIQNAFPNHEIVAEESFGKNADVKQSWKRGRGPTWFVDPLDGTLNATHLFPLHCISIGFACSHKHSDYQEPIYDDALVGVIYAPSMGATEKASIAHGCSLSELKQPSNDLESSFVPAQRLPLIAHPLPSNAPSGILFASEWGKDRRRGQNGQGNLSGKMTTMTNMAANDWPKESEGEDARYVHGIRSLGSSTLDLAFVAQGSIDVLWEGGCWEWDVCAGVALLLESGGLLTDSNPPRKSHSPFWHDGNRLPRADLGARRFLAVRGCTDTETEKAVEAQERVAR